MQLRFSNIIILFVFSILLSCNSRNSDISSDVVNNPNSASGNQDLSALPAFKFTETEHNFGDIYEGETVAIDFKFKNVGKIDLVISDVSTSCGCTVPEFPKIPIRPGEEGNIKVTFNSEGRQGNQNKNIVIVANTQPNTTMLKIKAKVVSAGSQN